MKRIDTMEQWNILSAALHEKGYYLWQMQYAWNMKEGFHAWFGHKEKKDVEVVTFSENVHSAIVAYNN